MARPQHRGVPVWLKIRGDLLSLVDALNDPNVLDAVARDGAVMVEEEIQRKRGLRASALKAGYKTVKKLKPGIIVEVMRRLLPEFAPAIDPFYQEGIASGNLESLFSNKRDAIADAMLAVTDARAQRAENPVLRRVYGALRGQAKAHTAEAVPRLAGLIQRHVS